MKAVICANGALGVHIHTPGAGIWQVCQCGCTGARWEDPEAGRLAVACRGDRERVFGLGLNNQLLLPAITASGQMWQDYRRWHDAAADAPGYVFDKAKAGCWAVVFRVGSTSDTRWATGAEQEECFASFVVGEQVSALDSLIRDVLESLCRRDGLPLDSAAAPGEPARNYELADRLGIGHVFGLKEQSRMRVIVKGQETDVEIEPSMTIGAIATKGRWATGYGSVPFGNWEIRSEDGILLDPACQPGKLRVLVVELPAGVGG